MKALLVLMSLIMMNNTFANLDLSTQAEVTARSFHKGTYKHVVLFRYKEGTSEEDKQLIRKRILALKEKCKRDGKNYFQVEVGYQNSHEGVGHNFEEGFVMTFKSEGDRNFYVGTPYITDPEFFDPEHQKFKEFIGPHLMEPIPENGVLVFDFKV